MKFVSKQRLATNTAESVNNLQTQMAHKTHLNHQTGRSKVNSGAQGAKRLRSKFEDNQSILKLCGNH